jgi:hypothetical protein
LTFLPGQTTKVVSVPILDTETSSGTLDFIVALENPTGGVLNTPEPPYSSTFLGNPPWAAVVIVPDTDLAGKIQLSSSSYVGSISGGTANVVLTRTGGTAGNTTVNIFTSDQTASNGVDYTSISTQATFGPFQTSVSVPIAILNTATAGRTFGVQIFGPNNGATLGTPSSASVTIVP